MAAANDVTLTNNSSSKDVFFRAVTNWRIRKVQTPINIPLINQGPTSNVIFRFSGQVEEISFDFGIFNDSTDVSNGTEGGGATTVKEQIAFIKNTIFTAEFDGDYNLVQTVYYSGGITCVISALQIDQPTGSGTLVAGNISLMLGKIGAF